MSECSASVKSTPDIDWNKRQEDPTYCYPTAQGSGVGYSNLGACLGGGPTCARNDCPDPLVSCKATTASAPTMRENYSACCRPQPYANLNQTWKRQGKFDL